MIKNIKSSFFIILIFILLALSSSQLFDNNVLKAAGCLSLVKKLKNQPTDQRISTAYLLSCFINIDEDTAQTLLKNQYYDNKMGIEESEIIKLIDFNSVQKRLTEDQLAEYSKSLNKALEPLRDNGSKSGENHNNDENNPFYSENQNNEEEKDFLESFIKSILKLFTSSDSLLLLFIIFIAFYYCLKKLRKLCSKDNKDNNNNIKKSSKSNKNTKKKKK